MILNPDLAPMRDIGDGGGGYGGGGPTADAVIKQQLESLNQWAIANERDATKDRRRFWFFKLPAILCAASTAALETLGLGQVVVILGVISAICIAIDAIYPGGLLYNTHRRAANDIFQLREKVKTDWDKVLLAYPDSNAPERNKEAQDILTALEEKKQRIHEYITVAEASLDIRQQQQVR